MQLRSPVLALVHRQPSTQIPDDMQEDTGGAGLRVLVVEDNIDVGQFASQILTDLDYVATWATNGEEAIDRLERAETFDVVFSDVVMPGMGGIELAQQLR